MKVKAILCMLIFHAFLFSSSTGSLTMTIFLNEKIDLHWEPSHISANIYPLYNEEIANYSFSTPAKLTCSSSLERGWSITVNSDRVDLNNNFLLVSENGQHSISYILVTDNSDAIKNQDKIISVPHFNPDPVEVFVYPTILGSQLKNVPSGYYASQIVATFTPD